MFSGSASHVEKLGKSDKKSKKDKKEKKDKKSKKEKKNHHHESTHEHDRLALELAQPGILLEFLFDYILLDHISAI